VISLRLPPFVCSESIRPYLLKIFKGEYDVPLFIHAPTILDIGANVGAFSVWASHRWVGANIFAYEPHPETYKLLKENLILYPEVKTFQCGLGKPGLAYLYDGVNNEGEATIYPNPVSSQNKHVVTIDDPLCLPLADILKIDTEGCELDILEPLITAGRSYSAILIEHHRMSDRRKIDRLLEDYILVSCDLNGNPHLGTVKYIHKLRWDKP
jgi:FkbM family methyltransferase